MKPTRARAKLDAALAAYEAAADAVYKAAAAYARDETRALSLRYPRRRVEYFAGMGACSVSVEKRGTPGHYEFTELSGERVGGHEIVTPAFLKTLMDIETETRLNGMGDGIFVFKNGAEIKER